VFFGRMVPIVRSFVSVPAGVVKMPFGQFLLYTAGGSLIWNSVLIGLGVAAGNFVRDNLKLLDYAVVAAVVLGIAWMVFRRVTDLYARRHPDSATARRKEAKREKRQQQAARGREIEERAERGTTS
jgi:membrane protein DedA with SNARE-associated domain